MLRICTWNSCLSFAPGPALIRFLPLYVTYLTLVDSCNFQPFFPSILWSAFSPTESASGRSCNDVFSFSPLSFGMLLSDSSLHGSSAGGPFLNTPLPKQRVGLFSHYLRVREQRGTSIAWWEHGKVERSSVPEGKQVVALGAGLRNNL